MDSYFAPDLDKIKTLTGYVFTVGEFSDLEGNVATIYCPIYH
jgi:hypothetical protein